MKHDPNFSEIIRQEEGVWAGTFCACVMARVGIVLEMHAMHRSCAPSPSRKPITVYTWHCLSLAHWHILSPLVLVVMSLLLNLGSPIKEVRRAAVQCLQALSGVASKFQLVIDHLVPKAEEITSDATYVAQVGTTVTEGWGVRACGSGTVFSPCTL